MKINRHTMTLMTTVLGIVLILVLAQKYFGQELSNAVTVVTAIIGGVAILYQLRKDYQISKAEFIYSLNDTFSSNSEIAYIYSQLKLFRDGQLTEITENDGRRMGDYVMFFEIMNYLLEENMVTMDLIDRIFANKFFIFTNNPYTQEYQLKYSEINRPIIELYCSWFNFRLKKGSKELYSKYSFSKFSDYFLVKPNREIYLNPDKMNVGYD